MPYTVTPSDLVDIDPSGASFDDFLEVILADNSRLYVRPSSNDSYPYRVLDNQLLPPQFKQYSLSVVEEVLACTGATRIRIERVFDQRADKTMDLETYIHHAVCHEPVVSAAIEPGLWSRWRQFNIGDRARVQIAPHAEDWRLPFGVKNWIASSEIVSIQPIDRRQALENFQNYRSPDQAWPEIRVTQPSDFATTDW